MDKADSSLDDTWLFKLSGDGSLIWSKTYGEDGSSYRVYRFSLDHVNGGYILGTDYYPADNSELIYFTRVN